MVFVKDNPQHPHHVKVSPRELLGEGERGGERGEREEEERERERKREREREREGERERGRETKYVLCEVHRPLTAQGPQR